ncbi:MAG: DNA-processing protein DprA [Spirochaetota bacterium]|nr:DNA-processing protein DprA [Spirochaetota bacterium]
MIDKYLYTLIAFSATDIIGYNRFISIKKKFNDISEFLECDLNYQMNLLGLKTELAKKILLNMKKQADIIIEQCEQKKINFIPHNSSLYPPLLKDIIDPPYLLYSQGIMNPTIPLIAVIGTRNSTPEAEEINKWFCKTFAQYGLGVVSGLAKGHDAIASDTVLKHEGYTIGVLGTAIDTVYPSSSSYLFQKIREKGVLISEYPPGMTSTKWRFPRRNRIVSGLSQAVCVIQAPEKSGTMITVNIASEQGKDVYAVPGNPMINQNSGTNILIQKGTKLALNPIDIIQDVLKSNPNLETIQFLAQDSSQIIKKEDLVEEIVEENQYSLSTEEVKILELAYEHIHIDEISRTLEMNISTLNGLLTMMEIRGLIIQKPGQIYIKKG